MFQLNGRWLVQERWGKNANTWQRVDELLGLVAPVNTQPVIVPVPESGSHRTGGLKHITVAKINKYGHIHLYNGRVFDKFGDERNKQYSRCHLMSVADCQQALDRQNVLRERWGKISQIRNIADTLHESGVSDETKSQLIQLIQSL